MDYMLNLSLLISSACYFAAWLKMIKDQPNPIQSTTKPFFLWLITAGVVFQAYATITAVITADGLDLRLPHAILFAFFTCITLTVLFFNRRPVYYLALTLLPLEVIANTLPMVWQTTYQPGRLTMGTNLHILSSIVAFSLLLMAAVQAALLSIQNAKLKAHQTSGVLSSLPPLQTMESLLFEIITLGTISLSLSIISGFIFLEDIFAQKVAHKSVFTMIAWFIFTGLLISRKYFGIRGTKAIKGTFIGYGLLLLGFLGSKWVLEILLNH